MTETTMLWGGRFTTDPHPEMIRMTRSIGIDMRLLRHDLDATKAHAAGLVAAKLLTPEQELEVARACGDIAAAAANGELAVHAQDEDVHSVVERELTERLGDTGRRIHAGRSRNDLVATDLRLWCRDRCDAVIAKLDALVVTLADLAAQHAETLMPAYTHLQRAQPVSLGFHLLAHATALTRDRTRFTHAREAADVSALGAGAVAGTTLPLDPAIPARELGFSGTFDNAMDAVSDRDFACDFVYAASMCAVHLSRMAEEIVLWTTSEYGFARLSDEWSTGSSMMPQKRNPDLAELVRGRTAAQISDLTGLLILLKGLPLAYQRDLQEDKGFLFGAGDRIAESLTAMDRLFHALTFDVGEMEAAVRSSATWATDVAEALVLQGLPFRVAHETAGRVVAAVEDAARPPAETTAGSAFALAERLQAEPMTSLQARSHRGATGPARVREEAARLTALAGGKDTSSGASEAAPVRHLVSLGDLEAAEVGDLLRAARRMKADPEAFSTLLSGRHIACIYEHPSTRTRVSFDAAIAGLGASPITMQGADMQLGRGETVADTARSLSRYVDAIVIRARSHADVEELARAASVPVVNALTDREHPCQTLADLMTVAEHVGPLRGTSIAFVGDGNNVAASLLLGAAMSGMDVRVACPLQHGPERDIVQRAEAYAAASGGSILVTADVAAAVMGAQVLYTDVWTSMGREDERDARAEALRPYQLNSDVVEMAADGAIVLHCLPAHRNEEITDDVIDGPQSVVWDQAENRLHAQKAVLAKLLA